MSPSEAPEAPEPQNGSVVAGGAVSPQDAQPGLPSEPLVVLPVIDWDHGKACLSTLGPDVRARMLLIDNALRSNPSARHLVSAYRRPAYNIGVARSFNAGVAMARSRSLRSLIWLSATIRFVDQGACLSELARVAEQSGAVALTHRLHWHCVAIPMTAFDRVGLFDENFYPAYVEDTDWRRRWTLDGGEMVFLDDLAATSENDGHGYDTLKREMPTSRFLNMDALNDYYAEKWGGAYHPQERGGEERFERPFGREDVGLDYWPAAPSIPQLARRYGISIRRRTR